MGWFDELTERNQQCDDTPRDFAAHPAYLGVTRFCKRVALVSDGMVQEGQTLPAGGAAVPVLSFVEGSPALKK